jgi:hypothetical protein
VPGSREHQSLVGQLNALTAVPQPTRHRRYHWPTVANTALAAAIRALFAEASPAALAAIDALEQAFAAAFQASVPAFIYRASGREREIGRNKRTRLSLTC